MWSCVQLMMTVQRDSSAVQMGVVMSAKLECFLEFVSLRGESSALVKTSQLEMDATHGNTKLTIKFTSCTMSVCVCVCVCVGVCVCVCVRV